MTGVLVAIGCALVAALLIRYRDQIFASWLDWNTGIFGTSEWVERVLLNRVVFNVGLVIGLASLAYLAWAFLYYDA